MATTKPVTTMEPDDDKPKGKKPTDNEFDVEATDTDKVSNTDDIPDEFSTDDSTSSGLSTEDLNKTIFNDKQYDDDYKKMNPPTGDWNKEDRWETFKLVINTEDSMPGDINPAGRTFYSIAGRPESRTVDGIEHTPMLFFRGSPDRRFHHVKTSEFDAAYKMFVRMREVYLSIHGERMRTPAQLKYMLEEDNYVLRTGNGDNGPMVYDIKVKRVGR